MSIIDDCATVTRVRVTYEIGGERFYSPVDLIDGYSDESSIPRILAIASGIGVDHANYVTVLSVIPR